MSLIRECKTKKEVVERFIDGKKYWVEICTKWYKELVVGEVRQEGYQFKNKEEPEEDFRYGSGYGSVIQENNYVYRIPCQPPEEN